MLMALTAKNKTTFINSSIPQSAIDYLLYGAWNRCNNMVDSWILNSVAWEIADSLLYISTTTEIWNDLRERFHQTNAPRIFKVRKALMALNQGAFDVNTYYTRHKILWDELKEFQPILICHCGMMKAWMEYQQKECVI